MSSIARLSCDVCGQRIIGMLFSTLPYCTECAQALNDIRYSTSEYDEDDGPIAEIVVDELGMLRPATTSAYKEDETESPFELAVAVSFAAGAC